MVKPTNAQTTPPPSIPKFSLQYVDGSYDVPTTQTIDPYTGQTITHQGYHVNLTVFEMVIQNQLQPIDDLYYSIRVKGHYSTEWISFFDLSEGLPLQDSSSQQTIIQMGTLSQDGLTLQGAHKSITIPAANISPSPTPTIPELSWLVIVLLLLCVFSVAVVVRHRKNTNNMQL